MRSGVCTANLKLIPVQENPRQSNGVAESSVNVVKGHVRSVTLAVESICGEEVFADHGLLTWFVSYAIRVHRRFSGRS